MRVEAYVRFYTGTYQSWQIANLGAVPNEKFLEVESEKGQYWKWVPLLEMGRPFLVLVNCVFGYLHIHRTYEV